MVESIATAALERLVVNLDLHRAMADIANEIEAGFLERGPARACYELG